MRSRRWSVRRGLLAAAAVAVAAGCSPAPGHNATEGNGASAGTQTSHVTVPAGTQFSLALNQELSTRENKAGDEFTAQVVSPVAQGGEVVVPEGSTVRGRVTAVQASTGANQPALLKVAFDAIEVNGEFQPMQATLVRAEPETKSRTSTGEAAAKIGAGTAAGAIIGRIVGGDATGAVVGGAVGAAAGTAIVLGTQDVDAVLPSGSHMSVRLDEPLVVAG
jgi:hypothetical protein